jgi:hypothetical protein
VQDVETGELDCGVAQMGRRLEAAFEGEAT